MTKTILIIAGGYGERFWPMSRKANPKQFLRFFGSKSLLRITYERVKQFISEKYIFIISGRMWVSNIQKELPELDLKNLIKEPLRRDTALALGFATVYIQKRFGDVGILVCPSDHIIEETNKSNQKLRDLIERGFEEIKKKSLICIGLKPTRGETGYGYIKLKKNLDDNIYQVDTFIEKPKKEMALEYYQREDYLWNSGMFMWTGEALVEEMKKHLPDIYEGMIEIKQSLGSGWEEQTVKKVFKKTKRISIDYGLMEKSSNIVCIRGDFIWDDLGSWEAFKRFLILEKPEKNKNIKRGRVILKKSHNTMILGDEEFLISGLGLKDLIIIKSKDAILICDKNEEQNIKYLLEDIKEQFGERFL